jgi:hypothetical protein
MTKPSLAALVAAVACAGALAALADPASACSRARGCQRGWVVQPRLYARRYYRPHIRYYRANVCGYGDCGCIRSYALATGAQVWWDRYQACTGR